MAEPRQLSTHAPVRDENERGGDGLDPLLESRPTTLRIVNRERRARELEDEDPSSFSFDKHAFAWKAWNVSTERIVEHRKIITSFGSCSFDEPREDLRELDLL